MDKVYFDELLSIYNISKPFLVEFLAVITKEVLKLLPPLIRQRHITLIDLISSPGLCLDLWLHS
jgi:hypothetical protein